MGWAVDTEERIYCGGTQSSLETLPLNVWPGLMIVWRSSLAVKAQQWPSQARDTFSDIDVVKSRSTLTMRSDDAKAASKNLPRFPLRDRQSTLTLTHLGPKG